MGLSCGARGLKFFLFLFNLLFLICGIVCVGVGVWLVLDRYAVDNIAAATAKVKGHEKDAGLRDLAAKPMAVRQIGYLLLCGGVIVIIVAFMGCCGAARELRPLLCCYATLLMLILAIEIAAAIYAAVHSHMFERDFRQILKSSLKMYNGTDSHTPSGDDNSILVKAAWDKFMTEKECCGVDSRVGEFRWSGWYHLTGRKYEFPPACCPPMRNGKLMPFCPSISRYGDLWWLWVLKGCYRKIKDSVEILASHFKIVAWIAAITAVVQVFGVILAVCLCNAIRPSDDVY